jgi:hypothetical protein
VQVLNGTEELEKVVPSKALIEAALFVLNLDEGEEIALLHEFKHDKEYLRSLAVGFDENLSLAVVLN